MLVGYLRLRRFLRSRRFFEPIFLRRLGFAISLLLTISVGNPLGSSRQRIADDTGGGKVPAWADLFFGRSEIDN